MPIVYGKETYFVLRLAAISFQALLYAIMQILEKRRLFSLPPLNL
jgi:hypothetical protein